MEKLASEYVFNQFDNITFKLTYGIIIIILYDIYMHLCVLFYYITSDSM